MWRWAPAPQPQPHSGCVGVHPALAQSGTLFHRLSSQRPLRPLCRSPESEYDVLTQENPLAPLRLLTTYRPGTVGWSGDGGVPVGRGGEGSTPCCVPKAFWSVHSAPQPLMSRLSLRRVGRGPPGQVGGPRGRQGRATHRWAYATRWSSRDYLYTVAVPIRKSLL